MNEDNKILIVEDSPTQAILLKSTLEKHGYQTSVVKNGREALAFLNKNKTDIVITDIMMPVMDGYQLLECLKADPTLRHIPVLVTSAVEELDSVVKCIELGADDYLLKPFNKVLLKARINAALEKKRLRDQEQVYLERLEVELAKSEHLLLNILPEPIANRLKQGQKIIGDSFEEATVLFADIVGFTELSSYLSPTELVVLLNRIFSVFDQLTEKYGLEKIKTNGDAYIVAGGLPIPRPDHAEAIAQMALDMQKEIAQFDSPHAEQFTMRIGISTGPVIAGVVGEKKFVYDLWGDTVNTASRLESYGLPGCIHVTEATYERLQDKFLFKKRGTIHVKGKGEMITYFLLGRKA